MIEFEQFLLRLFNRLKGAFRRKLFCVQYNPEYNLPTLFRDVSSQIQAERGVVIDLSAYFLSKLTQIDALDELACFPHKTAQLVGELMDELYKERVSSHAIIFIIGAELLIKYPIFLAPLIEQCVAEEKALILFLPHLPEAGLDIPLILDQFELIAIPGVASDKF